MTSNNVVDFPTNDNFVKNNIIDDDIDEIVDNLMTSLYTYMIAEDMRPNESMLIKDSALVMECIKSLIYKVEKKYHPLQEFAEKAFTIREH